MILSIPHPWGAPSSTPCAAVQLDTRSRLWVAAPRHADPPPQALPGALDGLWNHEVVELFLAPALAPHTPYLEVELGPHGHHLVLRLRAIRERDPTRTLPTMPFTTRHTEQAWVGVAHLDPDWVPAGPLRALACHVFGPPEARTHRTSTSLPGAAPDFHQPASFPPATARHPFDPDRLLRATGLSSEPLRTALVRLASSGTR